LDVQYPFFNPLTSLNPPTTTQKQKGHETMGRLFNFFFFSNFTHILLFFSHLYFLSVVYFFGDVEAGLAYVAIGFARGEWVLVEVRERGSVMGEEKGAVYGL
jgi:hypothetical protein